MEKILILGAGLVARPIVSRLLKAGYFVSVADIDINKAAALVKNNSNGKALQLSVENIEELRKNISVNDHVVSLLPYKYHAIVAQQCIVERKNMVTTSYVKPEMQALDNDAKKAGIIILNETGLDPGIDHMSAKRIIDNIHKNGGKVQSFYSVCGALPAPENADNPFKYKFSWSPKGVIMAGNNDAKYLYNGNIIQLPTAQLFSNPVNYNFQDVGNMHCYPNRDSLSYIDLYGIPEVKTMYRGTFRYTGWCEIMDAFKKLNLLTYDKFDFTGLTYPEMIVKITEGKPTNDIRKYVTSYLKVMPDAIACKALEWLGFFNNIDMKRGIDSPFEITSDIMISKMGLNNDERDMVAMLHVFVAKYNDGAQEVIQSKLIDFGSPSTNTSIARTVALPASIASEMIIKKNIDLKGVYIPVLPEIYNPILNELENEGIKFVEEYGLDLSYTLF